MDVDVGLLDGLLTISELHLRKNSCLLTLFFFVESQEGPLPFDESKLVSKVSIFTGSDRELDTTQWSCLSCHNLLLRCLTVAENGCSISPLYPLAPLACRLLLSTTTRLHKCSPLLFVLVQVVPGAVSRCQYGYLCALWQGFEYLTMLFVGRNNTSDCRERLSPLAGYFLGRFSVD